MRITKNTRIGDRQIIEGIEYICATDKEGKLKWIKMPKIIY